MEVIQLVLKGTDKHVLWSKPRLLSRYMLSSVEVMFALEAHGMVIPLFSPIDYRELGTSAYTCMYAYKTVLM